MDNENCESNGQWSQHLQTKCLSSDHSWLFMAVVEYCTDKQKMKSPCRESPMHARLPYRKTCHGHATLQAFIVHGSDKLL